MPHKEYLFSIILGRPGFMSSLFYQILILKREKSFAIVWR